jgi:predicted enzyme related to lactoylglutathione lyase
MQPQNPNKLFPLFVTKKLAETKRFYSELAGFTITHDLPNYLQVASAGPEGPELCFMNPDGFPGGGPWPEFAGAGVIMSIPVPNADAKHAALVKADLKPLAPPSDKPWGWRSFQVADPNGVVLDYFHTIEAKGP